MPSVLFSKSQKKKNTKFHYKDSTASAQGQRVLCMPCGVTMPRQQSAQLLSPQADTSEHSYRLSYSCLPEIVMFWPLHWGDACGAGR